MSEAIVVLKDINKAYQNTLALQKVNITINRGDIYGLVGNNGAGKTTVMRIIAGQTLADQGSMTLFGKRGKVECQKVRKRMGTLIEEPGFYPHMTAQQNLEYFRRQFGIPGSQTVDEVLSLVGLSDCGNKKYVQFSLGMKQRLGIALALLHNPEFLMLDEPINGLDPAGIIEVRKILVELNQKRNTTILISSHILAEMANVATKYGFLNRGKMMEEVAASSLLKKCNSYLDVKVKEVQKMCMLLEKELNITEYKVYPDNHIHLMEGMNLEEKICEMAVQNHLGLTGIQRRVVNLENYYMNLVEGC